MKYYHFIHLTFWSGWIWLKKKVSSFIPSDQCIFCKGGIHFNGCIRKSCLVKLFVLFPFIVGKGDVQRFSSRPFLNILLFKILLDWQLKSKKPWRVHVFQWQYVQYETNYNLNNLTNKTHCGKSENKVNYFDQNWLKSIIRVPSFCIRWISCPSVVESVLVALLWAQQSSVYTQTHTLTQTLTDNSLECEVV